MKRISPLFFFFLAGIVTGLIGCPTLQSPSTSARSEDTSATQGEHDVSDKIALALGGTALQADEFVIDESFTLLELENNDSDLFAIEPREGFSNFTEGKGARVIPFKEGIGFVVPKVNGKGRDPIEVIIPPQKLIQILMGEARGELDREATLDEKDRVKPSSVSVTGDAVGATIRNRINAINKQNSPALFGVDPVAYGKNPPISYYEATIEANHGGVYQFSPFDPGDQTNVVYRASESREDLTESLKLAYDQAVLTAAYIFDDDTEDPTGGAFAFYSPSASEFEVLKKALDSQTSDLPKGAGTLDAIFPALAPVQALLLDGIAPSRDDPKIPSFVFVRTRRSSDPAVTDKAF